MEERGPLLPDSAELFERTGIHDRPKTDRSQRVRQRMLEELLPAVESVLDVGCGDGSAINHLPHPLVVGCDASARSLRQVKKPAVLATITKLPFPSGAFQLVMCNEVLEHLDPVELGQAAAELMRVTSRFLLVSVPYREDPLSYSHRCPQCQEVSNLYGHRTVFDEATLLSLFPGAHATVRRVWPVRRWSPSLLKLRTGHFDLWRYARHSMCPHCGNTRFENHQQRPLYRLFDVLNYVLHPVRTDRRWLMALLDLG